MSEGQALCICHTSGTTGAARAVVYSHRSVVLHALGALGVDSHGVSRGSVVLPLTPMFHLMAWGFPYSAALAPASLVLAGRRHLARGARDADRARARHPRGRHPDLLGAPARRARGPGSRPLLASPRALRGRRGAARPGRALRRGRRRVRVLLGNDRGGFGYDAAPEAADGARDEGRPASGRAPRSPASSYASWRPRAASCRGTAWRPASSRRAVPGSRAPTSTTSQRLP